MHTIKEGGYFVPRNIKYRKVCAEFQHKVFVPEEKGRGYITLTVEELEAMRLCDFEGLEQEEAAARMEISRGTLQRILYSARHKSAEALCEGKGVRIQGGTYEVADTCCCNYRCKRCKRERDTAI
jgi:predicted DNA-binding protein (UPF0251 family)